MPDDPLVQPRDAARHAQALGHKHAERIQWLELYSAAIARQFIGWGAVLAGTTDLVWPGMLSSPLIAAHPVQFVGVGAAILSGKKLLSVVRAVIGEAG